jgi:hypothetical protein
VQGNSLAPSVGTDGNSIMHGRSLQLRQIALIERGLVVTGRVSFVTSDTFARQIVAVMMNA